MPLKALGRFNKVRTMFGILEPQMPWHNPESAPLPAYYGDWPARYDQGEDMRLAYGVMPSVAAA